ncbi:MAG: hypothetical protein Ct9H300mP14_04470 [Gammaproteobacteria bacterium]|nr:MAG: hypothetical protein Ct9H300mP14_04470 [Gammaproteobacteria bacterium]
MAGYTVMSTEAMNQLPPARRRPMYSFRAGAVDWPGLSAPTCGTDMTSATTIYSGRPVPGRLSVSERRADVVNFFTGKAYGGFLWGSVVWVGTYSNRVLTIF